MSEVKRHRLLVVDDDPALRESLSQLLTRAGFDVETASTGREALARLLDEESPSAIVLDARMPGMSGEELVAVLRAYRRLAAIPVLLLTAFEDARRSLSSSVAAVMPKPFRGDDLVANVEALVDRGLAA